MTPRLAAWLLMLGGAAGAAQPTLTIDYPLDGTIFPPDFAAPTFLFRAGQTAAACQVEVRFADGAPPLKLQIPDRPLQVGEIDSRTISSTNEVPTLSPQQAATRVWRPDDATWAQIKRHSVKRPATVFINGGQVRIQTSSDPVGAPIFYRDVPLMPSETLRGVIKPLPQVMVPLIAWRLRNVAEDRSRIVMEGLHTCANCHSFSRDGKTLAMDMDGPENDKGLYTIVPVKPRMTIASENMIQWNSFQGKLGGSLRVAFMSQISPDGQYVVTTINDPGAPQTPIERKRRPADIVGNYYVINFRNYRFLQVFYATRGVLAWYSKATGLLQPLPGADDPRYVHSNAAWSPDGKYLVFARAEAKDAYPPNGKPAEYANDPNETPIQYDLYRIPFNAGKGGRAEPVPGASRNGMSNSFPKISPDGKWIVFVQARNGLLMRPDGQLYIVPVKGGRARRMRANTPLMNSWHSFSPNGRWLVFSSKSRSPYTQMYLTHIDRNGQDSPAILVENTTAANRAVNLPEFVNIPPDGLLKIDAPVTEFYRLFDEAAELGKKKQYEAAVPAWKKALQLDNKDARVYNNLGVALAETHRIEEAKSEYQKALELNPDYPEAHNNLGNALAAEGKLDDAIAHYQKAIEVNPAYANARNNLALAQALQKKNRLDEAVARSQKAAQDQPEYPGSQNELGIALARAGNLEEGIEHLQQAVAARPDSFEFRHNLGRLLAAKGRFPEALSQFEQAATLSGGREAPILEMLAAVYAELGRYADAASAARRALAVAEEQHNQDLVEALKARITEYDQKR